MIFLVYDERIFSCSKLYDSMRKFYRCEYFKTNERSMVLLEERNVYKAVEIDDGDEDDDHDRVQTQNDNETLY